MLSCLDFALAVMDYLLPRKYAFATIGCWAASTALTALAIINIQLDSQQVIDFGDSEFLYDGPSRSMKRYSDFTGASVNLSADSRKESYAVNPSC